jgi:polysaccharide deacetylase 2 family uncharacterized protein YibQ
LTLAGISRAFTLRNLGLAVGILCGLVGAGLIAGYVIADRLDAHDEPPRPKVAATRPAASDPVAARPPLHDQIGEVIATLPYTDNPPGQQRPAQEEATARPGSTMARTAVASQAWRRNAVPFADDGRRPLIAIVIDDMGLDRSRSSKVADLPAPLTLSWLPYARELREQAAAGRQRGHELLLHMPMEPVSPSHDPGPGALLVSLGPEELARRLQLALASFDGYVGLNNHMGSRFTAERAGMEPVIRLLKGRGLLFLDSRTTSASVGDSMAIEAGIPSANRHVFLDDIDTIDSVRTQLAMTERLARQQGFAIAIGHPHDATIAALAEWLPTLRANGLAAAPLTAVVMRRGRWQ